MRTDVQILESVGQAKKLYMIHLSDHSRHKADDPEWHFNEVMGCFQKLTPCWGAFLKPKKEEAEKYSREPFAFFKPYPNYPKNDKHYCYGVACYSMNEVIAMIDAEIEL